MKFIPSRQFLEHFLIFLATSSFRLTRTFLFVSLLTAAFCLVAFNNQAIAAEKEAALLALLNKMDSSYANVKDYTAEFHKHERVGGKLLPEESIYLKFKKPLMIYIKWIDGPTKEAIYVEGENGNKVIAHSGASLTWKLDPNGSILIAGNRHPITDIGFGFLLNLMRKNISLGIQNSEIEIIRMEDDTSWARQSIVVEAKFSPKEGRKYYATRMVCHIDKEYLLPVGISSYDENNALMEAYRYENVKINTGLTEMDFSRENLDYNF